MNNTVLERIGIDPIIIFIILILLIAVLFYLLHRQTVRYNQLKQALLHMNKVLRTQGVPVKAMGRGKSEDDEITQALSKEVRQEVRDMRMLLADGYQKTGIVKYDAFDEMGGKLSFVLAVLDGRDNGYLLNVMHSRDDCYTYIKEIKRGASYVELSAEEQIALEKAMHQDETYAEDREGIPTGHTGNLKRAYTMALKRQQRERAAANREAAGKKKPAKREAEDIDATAREVEELVEELTEEKGE